MSFLDYFDRFAPASWFDSGLTEVDEVARTVAAPKAQRRERSQSKMGGLLWGAATSVAMAGVIAAGVVTDGTAGGVVERVAVAPISAAATMHFNERVTSEIASHDYARPGIWAEAMSSIEAMQVLDESKYLDIDSFF